MHLVSPTGRPAVLAALAVLALLLAAAPGRALAQEPPAAAPEPAMEAGAAAGVKQACTESFAATQRLRREGKLVAAQREAIACAQAGCPTAIEAQCARWLGELRPLVPSVVIVAKDADGNDTADVRVLVDGEKAADRLDGRPMLLDPGPRSLRFEHGEAPPVERRIVVVEGQTGRLVEITFGRPAVAAPPARAPGPAPVALPAPGPGPAPGPDRASSGGVSPLAYVGFGVAAVGLVAGTVTGAITLSNASVLHDECTGGICQPEWHEDLDTSYALAHVSTASFAVAGAGAVLGLVGLLAGGSRTAAAETRPAAIRPAVGWGAGGVAGQF
ncbi:MAG: hypothetical protein HY744_27840 [Deltaproteobacteria bacterium]|nr:hypothetical protein [Deltaproteobacteria bacterium]